LERDKSRESRESSESDSPDSIDSQDSRLSDSRRWPFSIARAFAYTRLLESRIEELEAELEEKDAYIEHLANMGLAMRGIPPPKQQPRRAARTIRRPVSISAIHAKHKEKFRERHAREQANSQAEESRVQQEINQSDRSEIQSQIDLVKAAHKRNGNHADSNGDSDLIQPAI
jgi:hypothetical protein